MPAPPATGDPEDDLSALALSLADNAMTTDGTPLSQLGTSQAVNGTNIFGPHPDNEPTAEDIMRALEAEQGAAASDRQGVEDPPPDRATPHDGKPRLGPALRRLRPRARWITAGTLATVVAAVLAVEVSFGGGTSRHQPAHTARYRTAGPTAGPIAAATDKFLAMEHAADRKLGTARTRRSRSSRPLQHRQTSVPAPGRASSGSRSSRSISSTSGTAEPVDTTRQASSSGFGSSSSSTSSGSSQPPPTTQSHTLPSSNSGSASPTPSKAALRSLVTGAGTCSCQ